MQTAADKRQPAEPEWGTLTGLSVYSETPALALERHDACTLVTASRPSPQYVNHAAVTLAVRSDGDVGRVLAHVEMTRKQARALAVRLLELSRTELPVRA